MFNNFDKFIETFGLSKAAELEGHLNTAAEILGISLPTISFSSHIVITHLGTGRYTGLLKEFPLDIMGISDGGYVPETQEILISLFDEAEKPCSFGHILFVALHELRHAWQHKYELENSSGLFSSEASLKAKSYMHYKSSFDEVDADSWAALYLERKTNYLPHKTERCILEDFTRDKKRQARMRELRKEYFPYVPKSSKVA